MNQDRPVEEERGVRPARRVLLVEDEDVLRQGLRRIFESDYEVLEARDGAEGLRVALDAKPNAVISDQRMPHLSGVELLTEIRSALPRTVRILVTAYQDYLPVVDALNAANVHHYFEKPVNPNDLRVVVDSLVRNAELEEERDDLLERLRESVRSLERSNAELRAKEAELASLVAERTSELKQSNEELRQANVQLRELAFRDGLTSLFNHRAFMEQLDLEISRSRRYGRQFSLLLLDIDDFKRVNDAYGHRYGDAVLRQFGTILRRGGAEALRHSDVGARYGGEEFCVILPETDTAGGETTAKRLCSQVEQFDWARVVPDIADSITVSIGVATFPAHATTGDGLLEAVDEALYRAKREGKNRVATYRAPS